MSVLTTNRAFPKAVDADDRADYLTISLAAVLDALDKVVPAAPAGAGRIPVSTGANVMGLLAAPAAGQVLGESGGVPAWVAGGGTGDVTLAGVQTLSNKTFSDAIRMSAAASQIVPGATSFSVRNNANSADNLLVANNGDVTVRNTLNTLGGFVAQGNIAGVSALATNTNSAFALQFGTNGGANNNSLAFRFYRSTTLLASFDFYPAGSVSAAGRSNVNTDFVLSIAGGVGASTIWDQSGNIYAGGQVNLGALLLTNASVAGGAGLRIPHGTAPSSPVNGDCWTTTAGLFIRINGATVGPLS